jgi:hypothetical protein
MLLTVYYLIYFACINTAVDVCVLVTVLCIV